MSRAHGDVSLTNRYPYIMKAGPERWDRSKAAALLLVLALHGALLYGLWSVRLIPPPAEAVTLFVNLITPAPPQPPQTRQETVPPAAPRPAPASEPPRPVKSIKPEAPPPIEPPHHRLAAEAPVIAPTDATEPRPPVEPVAASPAAADASGTSTTPPRPIGPVTLSSHLALACPVRTPPPYPPVSRRLGETGKVVLRVELDETGRVSMAQVLTSSGYNRLDAAALAAVKTWHCQPARRDGLAVRSVALQPFEFTLEGS
jgi:protein TonB